MSVRQVNPEVLNKSYSTPKSPWNSSSNLPFDTYVWQKRYRGEKRGKKRKRKKERNYNDDDENDDNDEKRKKNKERATRMKN